MPSLAQGLRLAFAASLLAGAACQGADPYYRNRADGGLGGSGGKFHPFATAGSTGEAGVTGGAGASDTAGASGAAGMTGAGGSGACVICMVKVQYTCRSNDTGQASFILDVTNESSTIFSLSSLTLRYWYTVDASKKDAQELDCDSAMLGCTNIVTSADTSPAPRFVEVMPPKPVSMPTANEYAEIAFKAGALALDPFIDTGEIQLRLHNKDFSPIDQTDDYSFNCAMKNSPIDWPKVTAYLDGVLVWGTEP